MSYNGSGTFNINTTGQPVVAGTVISSSAFNSLTTDLATGLTTAITKDGQTTTTARITFAQGFTSSLTTDSSSVSTGSIITGGGVGIAKALFVGTTANVAGAVTLGGIATFSAQPIFSSLTASSAVATDASKGLVSVTNTGTGNNVLATAPTIASANLTTALTLTGASGTNGQVLTSGGSGNAPTWTTAAASQWTTSGANIYYNSGNVGIGTASPATTLDVFKTSNKTAIFGNATANNGNYITLAGNSTSKNWAISTNMYVGAEFGIGRTSANGGTDIGTTPDFMISSVGQVLVGTTSAISSAFMTVLSPSSSYNGLTVEVPNVAVYPLICSNTSGTGDNPFVAFQSDSSHTLRGQIYYNRTGGITVYATSSDQRLKENIVNSGSGLEKLANVKIRSFDWKENGIHTDFGVVAQELYEVAPEAVGVGTNKEDGSMDRPWNVGTAVLVPAMIKAIQELKALNDTLTARIVALENA